MQLRPASVPRTARFSRNEGWWQVGDVRDGMPFGRWRTYRVDGSVLFEARFDAKGRLQGAYRRFHPDGSLAREARYAHGKLVGELVYHRGDGDVFPCGDERVQRVVVTFDSDGDESERELFDASGRTVELDDDSDDSDADGTSSEGVATPAGALDDAFLAQGPDGFATSAAFPSILATFRNAPPRPVDEFLLPVETPARRWMTPQRFAELYGRTMPADLKAWREIGDPDLVGVRPVRDDDIAGDGNVIEALIAEHQAGQGRFTGLRELAAGLFALGQHEDDRYCVALCETANGQPTEAVYVIRPAANLVDLPDARSLDDFAYVVTLATAVANGSVSTRAAKRAYRQLEGKLDLRPPLRGMHDKLMADEEDDQEIVGDDKGDHREGFWFRRGQQAPNYYFFRSRWILRLLCGNTAGAAADFNPKYDGGLDDTRYQKIRVNASKEPFVAFYWLFRCLVFGDDRLDDLLRACGDTPSRLVRELAQLVGELAEGRRQVGAVDDFGAAMRAFRALDPLSNKEPTDDDDDDDDDDGAGEEDAHEAARPAIPEGLESAAAVIDWARNAGYEREDLLLREEVDVSGFGLAMRADPAIVPILVAFVDEISWLGERFLEPWLDGDRIDVAELLPVARRWLGEHDLSKWELAAHILKTARSSEDAEALGKVIEPLLDEVYGNRGGGFSAAMGRMQVGDALPGLCEAIGSIGIPDSIMPAFEAAVMADNREQDDARGPCAWGLATAGRGLDAIVDGMRRMIAADRAKNVTFYEIYAVGKLGAERAEAQRHELAQMIASIEDLAAFDAAGQALAIHALTGDGAIIPAVRAALESTGWREEITRRQRITLLGIIAERDDLPGDLALPYVLTDDIAVHRAAVRTLRARGIEIPPYAVYDRFHLATLARAQLEAALCDPRGIWRSNIGLWMSEHLDPASAEALVRAAKLLAMDPASSDQGSRYYEMRWIVRALVMLGAEASLVELLVHDNRGLADPVLRYSDKLGPGAAAGMAHVFVTDSNWQRTTAKSWLAKHRRDPLVIAALEANGLVPEDVSSRAREEA